MHKVGPCTRRSKRLGSYFVSFLLNKFKYWALKDLKSNKSKALYLFDLFITHSAHRRITNLAGWLEVGTYY